MPNFSLENQVRRKAGNPNLEVAGIDEVGMGALAGPIITAAVVLPQEVSWVYKLDDSKRLTPKKRQQFYDEIIAGAVAIGMGFATNEVIDDLGLGKAHQLAILMAYSHVEGRVDPLAAVVDGQKLSQIWYNLGGKISLFVDKADTISLSVAAASIVAKVTRDGLMEAEANRYNGYGFERNKGYGTEEHIKALRSLGPCPIHRRSFAPVKSMSALAELRNML